MDWNRLADEVTIGKTVKALEEHGFEVFVADSGEAARNKALETIPNGAEVFTATSMTTESIGLAEEINASGRYDSVRSRLNKMHREREGKAMNRLGSAPEWVIGSVHAVTEDGKVMIASKTGSQLSSYAYGAQHVIWIIGAQKIVGSIEEGFRRIDEHSLPLESERARKAYGVPGSAVNKILIVQREDTPKRITIILVKENLGF